jgi:opine dehydrogenase
MTDLKLAIIGAGNAGVTLAANSKLAGAPDVRLYDLYTHELSLISDNDNCVELRGNIDITGRAQLDLVTSDADEVANDANFFVCDTPANAHADVVRTFAPFLEDGDVFLFHPGRTGAVLEAREILNEMNIKKSVILLEAQTLLYACRVRGSSATVYGVKDSVSVAGEDPTAAKKAIDQLGQFVGNGRWRVEESVLTTSLGNIGMLFHPAVTLFNLSRIQGPDKFMFYTDGASELVASFIHKMDLEKLAVGHAYGVKLDTVQEWLGNSYGAEGATVFDALHNNVVYHGLAAPSHLTSEDIRHLRYIVEDVPCGLVPFSELGRKANVKTPHIDAIILLASATLSCDFRAEGLTLERLGLAGKSVAEISAI